MSRRLPSALAALALLFSLAAQPLVHAAPPADTTQTPYTHGLLWRIDVKGVPPSYLFGTLHHDDERVLELPPPVKRAFAQSRELMVEALNDGSAERAFRRAMFTREPALPGLLGDDWPLIEGILREHDIPKDARPHLKPWAAMITVLRPREAPRIILDSLLQMEARKLNKPIDALETVEQQIDALNDMPLDSQVALLRQAGAKYDEIQQAVMPLVSAYLGRDLAAIWKLNGEAMAGDADMTQQNDLFLDRILFQRSAHMAEHIASQLQQGGVFAAFGALHLYGERGVPALLAARGYKLTRVY